MDNLVPGDRAPPAVILDGPVPCLGVLFAGAHAVGE